MAHDLDYAPTLEHPARCNGVFPRAYCKFLCSLQPLFCQHIPSPDLLKCGVLISELLHFLRLHCKTGRAAQQISRPDYPR